MYWDWFREASHCLWTDADEVGDDFADCSFVMFFSKVLVAIYIIDLRLRFLWFQFLKIRPDQLSVWSSLPNCLEGRYYGGEWDER